MKIKVVDLTDYEVVTDMEVELQKLHDQGFRIIDIAGAKRCLIILGREGH